MTWGKNAYGQLGNGTVKISDKPVKVKNLSDVVEIYAGQNHCIALKKDGTVWAWGDNSYGQLGDGTYINRNISVKVQDLKNIKSISAGTNHSLAVDTTGSIYSWGANYAGQLGTGKDKFIQKPTPVSTN